MSKLVTIFGGSGFAGRYVARRLAKQGWRIRVATRNPNEAMFVKPYGAVGQVEPVLANIRDDASVRAAMVGAQAVVNCVGSFDTRGKNTCDAVQSEGATRVARIAAEEGVNRLVHISAIGADAESESGYSRSKAEGEAGILAHFPGAVILRPSIMFGPEDQFFNRFAAMPGPVLPVVGAETRFQPVYVDDVAAAVEAAVGGAATPGVYELGGPEVMSFREMMQQMLQITRRRKLIVNLPVWVAGIIAPVASVGEVLSLGIVKAPITRDQIIDLQSDNVVSQDARGLADLGLVATSMEAILPSYLWRFRPSGQFSAVKESAGQLKG